MDIKEFIENFAGEFDETPMEMFTPETDYKALDKEARIQKAMLAVRQRYGANAVVKGMNLMEGATTMERKTPSSRA